MVLCACVWQVAVAAAGDVREHAVHVRVLRAARLPAADGRHRPPRRLLGDRQREPGARGEPHPPLPNPQLGIERRQCEYFIIL